MFIDTYSKPVRDDMLTKDGVKGTLDVKLVNGMSMLASCSTTSPRPP